MSCLAIYQPHEADLLEEPAILKFPRRAVHSGEEESPALQRARLVHANRCCPCCSSAAVDPIELNDGIWNAQLPMIPGTATVVAFHCNRCYHEWPAR